MKNLILAALLIACLAAQAEHPIAPERGFTSSVAATNWEYALTSGNGKFGALVFGQPLDETIVLNHARLFMPLCEPLPPVDTASHLKEIRRMLADGEYQRAADFVVELSKKEGYGEKRWTDPFVPAFDVRVRMLGNDAVENYSRSVNYATGEASVNWSDSRGAFQRQLFVSRPDDLIVLAIKGPKAGTVDCDLQLTPREPKGQGGWNAEKAFKGGVKKLKAAAEDDWMTFRGEFARRWKGSLQGYEGVARVVTRGGTRKCEGGKIIVRGADEVLVLTRIELLYDLSKSQIPKMKSGLELVQPEYAHLLARHAKVHGALFNRARLDLGGDADRDLTTEELLAKSRAMKYPAALLGKEFDAARYAVISSSGELFPNLQGIWGGTYGPTWSGDFTLNGNVECAIGANLSANMAECLLPFFDYLEAHLDEFRTNALRLYGCRGIFVPSRASTHGLKNSFDGNWCMTFWTAGAGWMSQFYYDYYLYTGDKKFLRDRALPFMREAALFYEDFLIEGADGKLMFSPSYSPENHPGNSDSQACINAAMDLGVARELLRNCIAARQTIGAGADDIQRWRALLAKLPDYQIKDGAVKEWNTPLLDDNNAHRHASHLYELFAGLPDVIATNPPLREAFGVTLENRLNVRRAEFAPGGKGPSGRPPGEMAFGIVQQGLAAASLRQGEDCGEIINWLSHNYWRPNLMTTHNPNQYFNADLCGGLPALLIRMLVDSQPGWIDLLPAIPQDWPDGNIEGIRARGQVEVRQLTWDAAKVKILLRSEISQTIEVRCAGNASKVVKLPKGEDVAVEFPRCLQSGNLNLQSLRNPVWTSKDNLRDPSVLKMADGYRIFYSRFSIGDWNNPTNWATASVFTKDFMSFEDDHDITPKGFVSPGDAISWHGRWLLPYQSYPKSPVRLCFSESRDLTNWSTPKPFLPEAATLPWNSARRVIDPSFVMDGDTLHCFFIGSGFRTNESGKVIRGNLMGHAITRDPKLEKWQILTSDAPLIGFSADAPDGVENTMIFKTGDHWTMIYSEGLENQHLALATSPDLIKWKLEGSINISPQKWMSRKYGAPYVWRDGSLWLMILMGTDDKDRTTFGLLTSPDGRQWKPLQEK
ncbi:MAG: glycoside hydrolase N-terminal domain-containing protein [Verrucomicrobiota bacterium]